MTLTEAKNVADNPFNLSRETLQAAHARLTQTLTNGGVRNSERASERLARRIARLENALQD